MSINLTKRFGDSINEPSNEDLDSALNELFNESSINLPEGDLAEHPNAWLTYNIETNEKWHSYTLDIYRKGLVIFTHNDEDYETLYEKRATINNIEIIKNLWQLLMANKKDLIIENLERL